MTHCGGAMRSGLSVLAIAFLTAACAEKTTAPNEVGSGAGAGGGAGTGGGAAGGGQAPGGAGGVPGTGGGTPSTCGNGQLDEGEPCDGDALGDETCAGLGFCGWATEACIPFETCDDMADNDQDGLYDCDDEVECADAVSCTDACAVPKQLKLVDGSGYAWGNTLGQPATHSASCSPDGGPEVVFEIVAPDDGYLVVKLYSFFGFDFG